MHIWKIFVWLHSMSELPFCLDRRLVLATTYSCLCYCAYDALTQFSNSLPYTTFVYYCTHFAEQNSISLFRFRFFFWTRLFAEESLQRKQWLPLINSQLKTCCTVRSSPLGCAIFYFIHFQRAKQPFDSIRKNVL